MIDDIAGRNRADEALKDANQFNIEIVSQAGEGIIVYDRDLRYVVWNRFMERMTGVAAEDVIGRNALDLFPHLHEQGVDRLLKRALNGETVNSPDIQFYSTFTDHKGWVVGTYAPHKNARGEIIGVIATLQDITKRKRAEDSLQISESKYRLLHNTMIDAFVSVDMDGRITGFNETYRKMLGFEPDKLYALTYTDLTPTKWHTVESKIVNEKILPKGYSDIYEKEYRKKDGTVFPVELRTYLLRDEAGNPTGMWAIVRDITERKRTEKALRESEERYRAFFNTSRDCVFITSVDGRWVDLNDAAVQFFGYESREALLNVEIKDLYANSDERIKHLQVVNEKGYTQEYPVTLQKKDGTIINTLITSVTRKDGQGRIIGYQGTIRDITDSKRAENALRESEQRLANIIDFLPDATFAVDREGKVIAWNRAIENMTGIAKNEMLNRGSYAYAVPFYKEPRPILIDLVFQDQKEIESKYANIRRKGDQIIAEAPTPMLNQGKGAYLWGVAAPLYDRSGSIIGAIESIRDITERKREQEKLQNNLRFLETMINTIPSPIFVKDKQGRYSGCNDSFARQIVGLPKESIIGKSVYELPETIPSDLADMYHEQDQELFREPGIQVYETQAQCADGVKRDFLFSKATFNNFAGEVAGIVGVMLDITERMQAEEALRTSHQILDGIINTIPIRVFWKNRDLVYLGCNAIFAQDAGFADSKDIVGKDDYQMGWRNQAELYRADDRQVIESGRSKLLIEEPQTTPEGRTIVLLTSKMPLRSSEGEIIGVLGTYMDITERKRMESELRRSRDELERRVKDRTEELARKNIEMERFIYTVSHDLRSPLVTVSGFVGLLKEDLEKRDSQRAFSDLMTIGEAVTKMDRLLLDTLELSRIGRVAYPPVDVPLGQIVQEALRQTAERIRSRNVAVYVAEDMPKVHADVLRIAEVLVNLIENSVKYMGDQGNPEIDIGSRKDGEETVFFVKDNGIGIDPKEHEKVFGLFYKVDRASEGTGAGLAIVKRIIEVHGGRIWIESELGEGCTVCFTLPLANAG